MNFKNKMNVIKIIIINVYDLYKIRITNTYNLYNKIGYIKKLSCLVLT
jgi:hypothetical protein